MNVLLLCLLLHTFGFVFIWMCCFFWAYWMARSLIKVSLSWSALRVLVCVGCFGGGLPLCMPAFSIVSSWSNGAGKQKSPLQKQGTWGWQRRCGDLCVANTMDFGPKELLLVEVFKIFTWRTQLIAVLPTGEVWTTGDVVLGHPLVSWEPVSCWLFWQ